MNGLRLLPKLQLPADAAPAEDTTVGDAEMQKLTADLFTGLDDDLNTARTIASLFNLLRKFNTLATTPVALASVSPLVVTAAATTYATVVTDILGLRDEPRANAEELLGLTLEFYAEAKTAKAYDKVDQIRAALKSQGIVIKDTKAGVEWAYSEE